MGPNMKLRHTPSTPRPTHRRSGAAAVEFALVVPIFFVIFFGMVDIARGFMVKTLLENSARVGCRTGILQGKSNTDVQAAVAAALSKQGINGTTVTITINGNSGDVSTAGAGDIVRVTVSVPVANITWLPTPRYLTGTISGTAALPHV